VQPTSGNHIFNVTASDAGVYDGGQIQFLRSDIFIPAPSVSQRLVLSATDFSASGSPGIVNVTAPGLALEAVSKFGLHHSYLRANQAPPWQTLRFHLAGNTAQSTHRTITIGR